MLFTLFRTNKKTNETQIVGQTTKEGHELDIVLRQLAGGNAIKTKEGDFSNNEFLVEAHPKENVKNTFFELGETIKFDE